MSPIILALDFARIDDADAMLAKVRPHIGMMKVGLEMFTAHGWDCLALAKQYDLPVFLDLKLYDIPTTVAKTTDVVCAKLAPLKGEHFLSVHCMGTTPMCKASFDVAQGSNVKVAGITLLTSFNWQDLRQLGYSDSRVNIQTVDIAKVGRSAGLEHFVCAPTNAALMKKHYGDKATLITPGIRLPGDVVHDHKNTADVSQAMKSGASWLVVGRPITNAVDPTEAARQFAEVAERHTPSNNVI